MSAVPEERDRVGVRNSLPLEDPMAVLQPLSGYLDVFAVASGESGASGALHHLYRAQVGQPVIGGVPPPSGVERFIAVPGPAAEIERTLRKDWLAWYRREPIGEVIEMLTQAVWEWSSGLGEQFVEAASGAVKRLVPGASFTASPGERLACDYGLIALEVKAGALRLFGRESAAFGESDLVFLSKHDWLEAGVESVLEVRSCESVDSVKEAFRAYRLFQAAFTQALCARLPQLELAGAERLKRRVRGIHQGLDEGALIMRRLLDPDASLPPDAASGQAAVLVAAREAAALQGIRLVDVEDGPADALNFVQAAAEASGVRMRQVTLAGEWWKQDNGPLLAFRAEDDVPLVLDPGHTGRYRVRDPATGKANRVDRLMAARLKPFACSFYRPFPNQVIHVTDLVAFGFSGQARDLWRILGIGTVIAVTGMVVPLATADIIDRVIPSAQSPALLQIGLVLLAAAVVQALFELSRGALLLRVENKMEHDIQAALWDRVLALPISFFREYTVGDLTMRVNAINMLYRSFSVHTMTVILSGLFALLNFVVLFSFSVPLALLALGIVVLAGGFSALFFFLTMHSLHHVVASNRRIMALTLQLVQGLGKLRTTASEARAFGLWTGEFALYRAIRFRIGRLSAQQKLFFSAYEHFAIVLVFVTMGALLAAAPGTGLSTGAFIGFYSAFSVILMGVVHVCESLIGMYLVVPFYKMAAPLLETLPESSTGKVDPGRISGAIEVSQLGFSYPEGEPVLEDVSFSVPPGSFTAIVGSSGSGKSTLLRLLLGFDEPSAGTILYDDRNLNDLDQRALRRQFGVVLQGSPVLAGDIFSNIVGMSGGTIDDAWEAARLAGLEDDIRMMPMGMHTAIGEGTSTLSGGQRQRILIARALVGKPRILFLDEATSALDNQSQSVVSESLLRLKCTRVLIAHRLSTIAEADQIVVLDQGAVVQRGSFRDLMADKDGTFAELARRQSIAPAGEDDASGESE